jgi:hypothetical protein
MASNACAHGEPSAKSAKIPDSVKLSGHARKFVGGRVQAVGSLR